MGEAVGADRKRLHITPFSRDLLDRFVPPAVKPLASNISFHTVETFPERGFGYVELPVMEAEKLKKKLNGATLKGTKVRIEDANPEKKRKAEEETEGERKARKKAKKEKRKREEGVLDGHELEEGRRVKRGWTEDGSEKKRDKKSKKAKGADDSLEGKKLKFRTTVPPNKEPVDGKAKQKADSKKDKKEKKAKRKTVVQEFVKAQRPSASAEDAPNGERTAMFDGEKGWVDEAGKVVEAAPVSKRPKKKSRQEVETPMTKGVEPTITVAEPGSDDEVSSVVSSDTPSESEPEVEEDALEQGSIVPAQADRPADHGAEAVADTVLPDAFAPPTEVHPLEALFKRTAPRPESATKPKPSPIDTSFSFFTSGATDDGQDEGVVHPPQTPHTKEDMEWRSIRSAAPTPDTAAIGKRFEFPPMHDSDEDEDDIDMADVEGVQDVGQNVAVTSNAGDAQTGVVNGGKEESAYRKWFYDNRGDLNRSWKKRRRDERKQKRQRENKRLGRRVA